jgi:sodium-independent sulfate anion transporter 11
VAKDRSWNDPSFRRGFRAQQENDVDIRPTLKAVILDFSTVNNVDLTSVQVLIDVRTQLDRFAAPNAVQWHFTNITNRWTKRALVHAGFGAATPISSDGTPISRQRVFAVGEMGQMDKSASLATKAKIVGASTWDCQDADIEMANLEDPDGIGRKESNTSDFALGKTVVTTTEYTTEPTRVAPVSGVNLPFFHVDLESAFGCAEAYAQGELRLYDASGLGAR